MRIQIEIDPRGVELLDRLRSATGLTTHKDVFNNAVTIFNWAVQQRAAGRVIASMDENSHNYKELSMPVLDRVEVKVAKPAVAAAVAGRGA